MNQLRGAVIFGHAKISDPLLPFLSNLQTIFESNQVFGPVLYIHGDGHEFDIETPFSDTWDAFTGIEVDQGGLADPLLITVAPSSNGVTVPLTSEKNSQIILGDGLFRVDRQQGLYLSQ